MSKRRRRRRVAASAAILVAAIVSSCVPDGTPVAPFKDAANGTASDHGWFEAGKVWRGDFGDPDVLRVGSTYYAYASPVAGRYLPVLTSTDLKTWVIHPRWGTAGPPSNQNSGWTTGIPAELLAYPDSDWARYDMNDALVRPTSWGVVDPQGKWLTRDYWATSVMQIGSIWYAYSAVRTSWTSDDPHHYGRFCLTVASAPSPLGPFRDVSGSGPIQCQPAAHDPAGSIDPYPYHDASNGKNYLLWKAAGTLGGAESALMSVELGPYGKPKVGAKWVSLLSTNRAAPWEGGTIENPSMIAYQGRTYLFYSANDAAVKDADGRSNYATGYAICPGGPLEACVRPGAGKTPLLASSGVKQGPGGASPVTDLSGGLRLAYATYWLGENRSGYHPRRLHIATLVQTATGSLQVSQAG